MKLHFALLQGCRSVLRGASVHCGITVGCGYGCNQANFCPHPSVMLGAEDNSCETFNQWHTAFLLLYNNKLLSASVFNVALTQVVVHAPGKQDKLQLQIIIAFSCFNFIHFRPTCMTSVAAGTSTSFKNTQTLCSVWLSILPHHR